MSSDGKLLFSFRSAAIFVPSRPHIGVTDGGHLIVRPEKVAASRLGLTVSELFHVEFCVRLAARSLVALGYCEWVNIQENGNWAFMRGVKNRMHVHVYGRSKNSGSQPFGEALRFPRFSDLSDWKPEGFDENEVCELKETCLKLSEDQDSRGFLSGNST